MMFVGFSVAMLSCQIVVLLAGGIFVTGLITRTKAIWAGRRGPGLNQFFFDLLRLCRKNPVYSEVTSWIFQVAPWVGLTTSLIAALLCPIVPGYSPISFSFDFVYVAYLLGLGRVFMILAAMDTGSSFEGMGASREATYSAFAEPALFFVIGTLGIVTGKSSFQDLFLLGRYDLWSCAERICVLAALFVLLQIESARLPVDDPSTHLELTMIHEVMILDNSGVELAAAQYGAALKLVVISGLIAALMNPFSFMAHPLMAWELSLGIIALVAIGVGLVESLIARLRLRAVPIYAFCGILAGAISLGLSLASRGGAP